MFDTRFHSSLFLVLLIRMWIEDAWEISPNTPTFSIYPFPELHVIVRAFETRAPHHQCLFSDLNFCCCLFIHSSMFFVVPLSHTLILSTPQLGCRSKNYWFPIHIVTIPIFPFPQLNIFFFAAEWKRLSDHVKDVPKRYSSWVWRNLEDFVQETQTSDSIHLGFIPHSSDKDRSRSIFRETQSMGEVMKYVAWQQQQILS